jgi:putative membrane protein
MPAWIISALVSLLVTAALFFLISKLPLGVEVDGIDKAIIAAIVFAVLNALVMPIRGLLNLGPLEFLFFPILWLLNVAVFGLTAKLVEGFRLRSIWSAIFGAFAFAVANQIVSLLLPAVTTAKPI